MKITYAGSMSDSFRLERKEADPLDMWFTVSDGWELAFEMLAKEKNVAAQEADTVTPSIEKTASRLSTPVAAAPDWRPEAGDRVEVRHPDGKWYAGEFLKMSPGLYYQTMVYGSLGCWAECRPLAK